jgi:carbonic anhydrase/acetyltransferase-like protein (isoleucine patch superfamily)
MERPKKFPSLIGLNIEGFYFYPKIHESVFIAPTASVIGNVEIGELSSVWYGVVIRGDVNWIKIGKGTNIQDNSVIHAETASFPTYIGDFVTVGHKATIHGCIIKDFSLIGIGAIVMNGAEIGSFSIVGAGAVITENTKIPPGTLAIGVPAKVKRDLTEKEIESLKRSAQRYIELAKIHSESLHFIYYGGKD